jgi:hypothetical protein
VGAWYFARCTQRFVEPTTSLVVLELAEVGGLSSLDTALPQLVASVRRIAPRAPIVVLLWVAKAVLFEQTAFEGTAFERATYRNHTQLQWVLNTALNVSVEPPPPPATPPRRSPGVDPYVALGTLRHLAYLIPYLPYSLLLLPRHPTCPRRLVYIVPHPCCQPHP